jgi:sulfite reductase alpha subunit
MAKNTYPTPMLDELESGPWPSFISGIKRLRDDHPDERINSVTNGLLGQLEHSYETRKGYWKGGTVSVYGYGGGIIPRFSEVGDAFPESKEFHTIRVQPPAGNFYTTDMLRQLGDSWEKHGSGLVTFHARPATSCLLVPPPMGRRSVRAHRHVLCRWRPLRNVQLQRAQHPPLDGEQLH